MIIILLYAQNVILINFVTVIVACNQSSIHTRTYVPYEISQSSWQKQLLHQELSKEEK